MHVSMYQSCKWKYQTSLRFWVSPFIFPNMNTYFVSIINTETSEPITIKLPRATKGAISQNLIQLFQDFQHLIFLYLCK